MKMFANGVAVNLQTYDPLFVGKKALCALTTGGREAMYTPEGPAGDIDVLLTFARGMFRTTGIEFLPPFIAYGVPGLTSDEREAALLRYRDRLASL